jgi:hypothetical protein
VGTDRKGPLAALIVVALDAVILLVSAVRGHADSAPAPRTVPAQASSARVAETVSSAASAAA